MSTQPPTPNIGLVLPVPNSGQPWRTTDYNTLFTTIDTAFGADRTRLTTLEGSVDPAGIGSKGIPAGSTSARDAFWGIPSDDAGGVALQQKGARWFNTDLGREQVYYGKYDATTNPYGWISRGWHAPFTELTPIDGFSLSGTGVSLKSDGIVKCTAATGNIKLDNVFWDLFDEFVIEKNGTHPASGSFGFQFIKADGTVDASSNYRNAYTQFSGSAIVGGNPDTTSTSGQWDAAGTNIVYSRLHLLNPSRAVSATTSWEGESALSGLQRQISNGIYNGSKTAFRGIQLFLTGTTFTGYFRIYGKRGNGA